MEYEYNWNMKIFIPQQLWHQNYEKAVFIGCYSPSREWLCLVELCHNKLFNGTVDQSSCPGSDMATVYGQINTRLEPGTCGTNGESTGNFISLALDNRGEKHVKKLILNGKDVSTDQINQSLLVEFNIEHLKKSLYFKDKMFHDDITDFLLTSCNSTERKNLKELDKDRKSQATTNFVCFCMFLRLITSFLDRLRTLRFQFSEQFCSPPAAFEQLKRKHRDCQILNQQFLNAPHGSGQLKLKSMLVRNAVDVTLGLALMWWFTSTREHTMIATTTLTELAQKTAVELQVLLNWMMGVPAGLKLNSQLDQFLGKFFLYHIYLWKAYVSVLKPVLPSLLWYISLSGCLGLSVQLALLQDLLSMLTLHIYCFYVYAARLYNFQMSGLSSLWRLFRGKKWNSLRQRVDSAEYDVNQLFVGTLLFTVLLFLLPTTALYYVIFLGLRVLVLMIQGSVYIVISAINNTPLYLLVLRTLSSHTVANSIEFIVCKNGEKRPLCMKMKFKTAGYGHLLKEGRMAGVTRTSESWGKLIKNVLTGHLIYPWLDKVDSVKN